MKKRNEKRKENNHVPKFSVFTFDDSCKNINKYDTQWLKYEIKNLSKQWQSWVEKQKNNEKLQAKIDKWKQESDMLLKKTTQGVKAFCEDEDVQKKIYKGKDKLLTASINVMHFIHEGMQETLKQENIKKATYNIQEKIDRMCNDQRVKMTVKHLKKEILQISESAYCGIKKILEENDDENNDTTEEHKL